MPQPPIRPVMARGLSRVIPFVTPRIFLATGAGAYPSLVAGASVSAEFDCLEGFADPSLFNSTLAYPGANTPKLHAVGPLLDCLLWADGAAAPIPANFVVTLTVEYAVDRGCAYRVPVAPTSLLGNQTANISGLRITGRFVRVTVLNVAPAAAAINLELGVYVRSA
jgi:hypothetical protein